MPFYSLEFIFSYYSNSTTSSLSSCEARATTTTHAVGGKSNNLSQHNTPLIPLPPLRIYTQIHYLTRLKCTAPVSVSALPSDECERERERASLLAISLADPRYLAHIRTVHKIVYVDRRRSRRRRQHDTMLQHNDVCSINGTQHTTMQCFSSASIKWIRATVVWRTSALAPLWSNSICQTQPISHISHDACTIHRTAQHNRNSSSGSISRGCWMHFVMQFFELLRATVRTINTVLSSCCGCSHGFH